jgi:ribonuclease-3
MKLFEWLKNWRSRSHQSGNFLFAIKDLTGVHPQNIKLYEEAFTHSSVSKELKGNRVNYERLEFLGDSILGAVVSEYLFHYYPEQSEGYLTSLRSKIVSRKQLNQIGSSLGLEELIDYKATRGTQAKSINGDALEALIGAIYLDKGFDTCKRFVIKRVIEQYLDLNALSEQVASYKSLILEWGQKERKSVRFKLEEVEGKSHNPTYRMQCWCEEVLMGEGKGSSKKKAEEEAAKNAFHALNLAHEQNTA